MRRAEGVRGVRPSRRCCRRSGPPPVAFGPWRCAGPRPHAGGWGSCPCIVRVGLWIGVARRRRRPVFGVSSSPPFPRSGGASGAGGGRVEVGFCWIRPDLVVCAGFVGGEASVRTAATAFVLVVLPLCWEMVAARGLSSVRRSALLPRRRRWRVLIRAAVVAGSFRHRFLVSGRGHRGGEGGFAVELLSPGFFSAAARCAPSSSSSLGVLFSRWSGSRSSSLLVADEGGHDLKLVVLQLDASPACWFFWTEADDFPSAMIPSADIKVTPAPGGSGGGGAAARLQLASVAVLGWLPRDPGVFSVLCGVLCTTGYP